MTRWISETQKDEWRELFNGYQKSAYRLEAKQVYSKDSEDEAVRRFVAGQPHGMDFGWALDEKGENAEAGRVQNTVRVVVEPPTDYTRWELSVYPEFDAAGEKIHIIGVGQGEWPANVPHQDYWLFDDRDVWRMHYHPNFRFVGAELLDDPDEIAQHLRWRDAALNRAVPLAEYLAAHAENARPYRT